MIWKRFHIPINEKTIPNIFSVMKGAILSTKVSKCHVATAHVDSIFLAIFCCSSDKIWDMTSVVPVTSVKRLKCVVPVCDVCCSSGESVFSEG